MPKENPFIRFEEERGPTNRKTKTVLIISVSGGSTLGEIRWYSPWRQYCFWPFAGCVFNVACLQTINEKIAELMKERRSV